MESPRVSRQLIARWLIDCVIFGVGMSVGAYCWRHGKPTAPVAILWALSAVLMLLLARVVSSPLLKPVMTRYGWIILRLAVCASFALFAADFWRHGAVLFGLGSVIWLLGELAMRRRRRNSAPVACGPAAL